MMIWVSLNIVIWHMGGDGWGKYLGLKLIATDQLLNVGIERFISANFLWFYIWFWFAVTLFAGFWHLCSKHLWQVWSIWGSALILFNIWLGVQLSVAMNAWYGPFWDVIQNMLSMKGGDIQDLYQALWSFIWIALATIVLGVLNSFFVSHYIFRWRTAMTDYYTKYWPKLKHVEGASQRIQEDTMRFSTTLESLGVSFVHAIMVLIAFFPLLVQLSERVPSLPIIGHVPYALVLVAIGWSLFGTLLLMWTGRKLPSLEFNNQKVEAAYRKELVYGEDHDAYAKPQNLKRLFHQIRSNYYRLYAHYAYFNVASIGYLQMDIIIGLVVLFPAIAAGTLSLGLLNQIMHVFGQVRESFQYLVSSWKTIIELLSIHKRLKAFESILDQD